MSFFNKSIKVLVIEDNPGDFILISEYLLEEIKPMPSLVQASKLSSAEQLFDEHTFDVVLLDLSLPDASGQDLVERVVSRSSGAPVIVLTGYGDKNFGLQTLSWGAADFLNKNEITSALLFKSIIYARERQRISQELEDSHQRYKNLFEQSPLPMWVYDQENLEFMKVNEAACRFYGYTEEEFCKLTLVDIRPREDVSLLYQAIEDRKSGSPLYQGFFRHKKKNGEIIYVDLKSNELIVDGKAARLVLATDITAKVKADMALENTVKRFKALVQEGLDLIAILDSKGVCSYMSPSAKRILGVNPEDMVGKSIFDFIDDGHAQKVRDLFDDLVKNGGRQECQPFLAKNIQGQDRWIQATFTNMLQEEAVGGIVVNSKDVSLKIRNEKQLKASVERYENIAKAASDAIYGLDLKSGLQELIGTGYNTLFGYGESEILRTEWAANVHPYDRQKTIDCLHDIIYDKKQTQGSCEYRYRRKDGSYAYVVDSFFVIYENEKPAILQGAMQDISALKFHELQLQFEKEIYELYASPHQNFHSLISTVALKLEKLIHGSYCSILKLREDNTVTHLTGPSLPEQYQALLNNLPIGPQHGSCGTAMYFNKTVIVEDIDTDPLWDSYRSIAEKYDLKACWSVPIRKRNGHVAGSFATYYKQPKKPASYELELITRAANVVGVLMENYEAAENIKYSNDRYDIVARATNDIIWDYNIDLKKVGSNDGLIHRFGFRKEDISDDAQWWVDRLHPEDREMALTKLRTAFKDGHTNVKLRYRFQSADGSYRHILDRAFVIRNPNGAPLRIIGAMQDITERENYIKEIEDQNRILKDIAWKQSHEVRAPLSRLKGLIQLLEMMDINEQSQTEILNYIYESANELDTIVREIVNKTEQVEQPKPKINGF